MHNPSAASICATEVEGSGKKPETDKTSEPGVVETKNVPIFRREVYRTVIREYFTRRKYKEAFFHFKCICNDPEIELTAADKAVLFSRIANCASDAVLIEGIDDPELVGELVQSFGVFLEKYLEATPRALTEQPPFSGTADEPKKRLKEAMELSIRFNRNALKKEVGDWIGKFIKIDFPGWGPDLALGVLMEKINEERTNYNRSGHIENTRIFCEIFIEVSEIYEETYDYSRAAVMNILSDLAYFEGGQNGEAEALKWATRCIEINPGDLFAQSRKKYIEQRQSVEEQIRRFRHDTGNTIAGINAALHSALTDTKISMAEMRHYLKTVQNELRQLYGVHRFIQNKQSLFEWINIQKEIEDILDPLEKQIAHFTIDFHGETRKWEVDVDYFRLAFSNLIRNSLEAFERRQIPLVSRKVVITLFSNEKKILIEDNAGGIDPSLTGRIFSPYVSSKGIRGKTGLGLSQARMAIEKMGGSLDFPDDQPEHGARFTVNLAEED